MKLELLVLYYLSYNLINNKLMNLENLRTFMHITCRLLFLCIKEFTSPFYSFLNP